MSCCSSAGATGLYKTSTSVPHAAGSQSLSKVVRDYTALTGRIPLPPTFALGYQQACYGCAPRCPMLVYRVFNAPYSHVLILA